MDIASTIYIETFLAIYPSDMRLWLKHSIAASRLLTKITSHIRVRVRVLDILNECGGFRYCPLLRVSSVDTVLATTAIREPCQGGGDSFAP